MFNAASASTALGINCGRQRRPYRRRKARHAVECSHTIFENHLRVIDVNEMHRLAPTLKSLSNRVHRAGQWLTARWTTDDQSHSLCIWKRTFIEEIGFIVPFWMFGFEFRMRYLLSHNIRQPDRS